MGGAAAAGGGAHGSCSTAGFSATLLAAAAAALLCGSASAFLSASSVSPASFGTSSQAVLPSGAALGLPGRVGAAAGCVGGALMLQSGIVSGLSVEGVSS